MIEILMFFGVIIFTIFILWVGMRIGYVRWNVAENRDKLLNYDDLNNQLSKINAQQVQSINTNNETINKANDTINQLNGAVKKTQDWYIQQLRSLSIYMKDKHKDKYLENQLNIMIGDLSLPFKKDIKYNINDLLEKISSNGIDSLTKDEIEFLKNNNNTDEK